MSTKFFEPCPRCNGAGFVESNSFHDVHGGRLRSSHRFIANLQDKITITKWNLTND